ncbi:MAG: hypothetical protein LBB11_03545 [Puniceicoccales bacterium]|jgi:hypothetical protein|nr:hypothetical protein [Puniceicoccales bacterium]
MAKTKQQGFALMIVISMLGLLLSLVVGFALLTNLENKKINNALHSPYTIAQQNALFAINDAVAKLQATAGIDTVVTAKADLLGGSTEGQKHWVGVWKVNRCDDKDVSGVDAKNFLTWLVSGDYYGENDPQTAIAEKNRISIIGAACDDIESVDSFLVDVINANGVQGQYAYWVDDQSLKIQCNLYERSKEWATISDYWFLQRQFQGYYGIAMDKDSQFFPLTQDFLKDNPYIAADIDYEHLCNNTTFSEQNRQYLRKRYHDFTNLSLGLIIDTRHGGFRKNLNDNNSMSYLNEVPDTAFMFIPPTDFPAPPPTWGYYKSFYNLYKVHFSEGIVPRATFPLYRPQSGIDYSDCVMKCTTDNDYTTGEISGDHAGDLGIATTHGVYPIWVEFKNYINLYYNHKASPNNSVIQDYNWYYQSLRMQPGFHLENPYVYNLAPSKTKVWHCAPYLSNIENSNTARYQKQPTFRCRFFDDNNNGIGDGLLQNYPNSGNVDNKIFPFLSQRSNRYMRPIWDCEITTNFPENQTQYLALSTSAAYTTSPNAKPLKVTTDNFTNLNEDENRSKGYHVHDVRFYQPESYRGIDYKTTAASSCWIESFPSLDSNLWNGTWSSDGDPWSPLSLRTTDAHDNILQQICDVAVQYEGIDMTINGGDRNIMVKNLFANREIHLPLYLICAGLRKTPSASSDYGHEFKVGNMGVRPLVEGNPRAAISCRTAHQDDLTTIKYSSHFIPGNWSWNAHWLGLGGGNGTSSDRGDHILFSDYGDFHNLFDLPHPRHKIMNLAFLQHMNVGCFSYHPAYPFGNAYQNPWIPREKFFQENAPIDGSVWPSHNRVEMLYDYSYCLNRALWDSYFYSSYDVALQNFLNHHHKAFLGAAETQLTSFKEAAKYMAIHGAFNVNSTSIEAWAIFLGSTLGAITGTETLAEFSRIQSTKATANIGLRQLTKEQIWTLAEKVVEQIKKRGIAGSLGEFVNRKLIKKENDPEGLGIKGALQTAIDSAEINNIWSRTTDVIQSKRKKTWFDDDAASGPFWAGKPGYLTQADILQSTSTTLCARGDTFGIHAYGNALDQNRKIQAEARCNAIVQRLPIVLDPSRPELGRMYKILSIQWQQKVLAAIADQRIVINHYSH